MANQEQERKLMSSYLNDTVVQSLSALHIKFYLLLSKPQTEKELRKQLGESITQITELVEETTAMARRLRPLELDALGLNAALQQTCEDFTHLTSITVSYKGVDLAFLSEKEAVALFRLAQEALVNILKHADASLVKITLQTQNGVVMLSIEDNGRGFSGIHDKTDPPGLSLLGLMLTFEQLHGEITIQSAVGEGTTITAALPYPLP
ncbi:MAG: ATP-binding protein [Candidatus Promineifilaceae bacterium]|nr:ATP-binding protein [Candidatus Promineifilaceae bacterium]